MSVVKINGITLSSILFEHLRADCDKEGLLLGTVTNVSSESISDAELGRTRTEQVVVVTSYIACEGQYSWYNSAGHVLTDKLNAVLSRNEHKEVVGWYKLRRKCSPLPSLRERVVHASLTKEFSEVPAGCFLYLLCTTISSNNLAAHSFDHTFLASPCNSNALQAIRVEIVNLKDTCQSDYLRSSSGFPDSTSHGSYVDISNTHRSLFISKDGILNTVQAVSHMSSDMCQRLEKLCNELTKSEDRIGALREDVVRLEDDIYMTKHNRTWARMQVAEQNRLAAVSAQQQHNYSPQPSEPDVNLIDFDADVASPVLQSASDLMDMSLPSSSTLCSSSPEVDDSGHHGRQHKKRPDNVPPPIAEVDLLLMDSDGEENSNKKSSTSPRDSSSTTARECAAPDSLIAKEHAAHVGSAAGSRYSATYSHTSFAPAPSSMTPSEANWQQTQPAVVSNKLATTTPAASTTTAMKFKKVNVDSDVSGLGAPSDHQRVTAGHNLTSTSASSNLKPTVSSKSLSDAKRELENKRASPLGNGATTTSGDHNRPLSQQATLPSAAPTSSTAARQSPLPQRVSESYHTGSGEASLRPGTSSRSTELGQVDSNGSVQQRQQQPKSPSLTKTGVSYDTTTTVPGSPTTSYTGSQFDRTSTARIAVSKSGSIKPGAGVARTKPVERGGSVPKTIASAVVKNDESDEDSTDDSVIREEPPRISSRKPSSKNNKSSPYL